MEGVYCRVVLDLFPEQHQVCVAAVDESKCQPINSWRDEDQDIGKVSQSSKSDMVMHDPLPTYYRPAVPVIIACIEIGK